MRMMITLAATGGVASGKPEKSGEGAGNDLGGRGQRRRRMHSPDQRHQDRDYLVPAVNLMLKRGEGLANELL
jgi:hypothetical protein